MRAARAISLREAEKGRILTQAGSARVNCVGLIDLFFSIEFDVIAQPGREFAFRQAAFDERNHGDVFVQIIDDEVDTV